MLRLLSGLEQPELLGSSSRTTDGWLNEENAPVRELKESAPSAWYGDKGGTGMKGMKVPGGKDGCLRRMYHPRLGL
jgi:hypothetical protein